MGNADRLKALVHKLYDDENDVNNNAYDEKRDAKKIKNGNRIRQIVRLVAKKYKGREEELKDYFKDEDDLVAGIASSAYHRLTGDFKPIQELEFGGLGAIIEESEERLHFSKHQMHHSKNSGFSLKSSINMGNSLWFSVNKDNSLKHSNNRDSALLHARNSDRSLSVSENSGFALKLSVNTGNSLEKSHNFDNALYISRNSGNSLYDSVNNQRSLNLSKNRDNALINSINNHNSLYESKNTDKALMNSENNNHSLQYSTNKGKALRESRNNGEVLQGSNNYNETLWDSKNTQYVLSGSNNYDKALWNSKNTQYALLRSENHGQSLKFSINREDALLEAINKDRALAYSKNYDKVLFHSANSNHSLLGSENFDDVLAESTNKNRSLHKSKNSGKALKNSKNKDKVLWSSINTDDVLWFSENSDESLQYSNNDVMSLMYSVNKDKTLMHSSFFGCSTLFSKNSGNALNNSYTDNKLLKKLKSKIESDNVSFNHHGSNGFFVAASKRSNRVILDMYLDDKIAFDDFLKCSKYKAEKEEFIKPLGKGVMGETYLVYHKEFDTEMVLKIPLGKYDVSLDERRFAFNLTHPNIAKTSATGRVTKNGKEVPAILMEYVRGKGLGEIMSENRKGLEDKLAASYSSQLLDGIEHMIERNLEHRDLHPGNVMVERNDNVKIIDFGIARELDDGNSDDGKFNRAFGGPNDIFSWALLTYKMYTGRHLLTKRKKDEDTNMYKDRIKDLKGDMRKKNGGLKKRYLDRIVKYVPENMQKPLILALENRNGNSDIKLLQEVRQAFEIGQLPSLEESLIERYRNLPGNENLSDYDITKMHYAVRRGV